MSGSLLRIYKPLFHLIVIIALWGGPYPHFPDEEKGQLGELQLAWAYKANKCRGGYPRPNPLNSKVSFCLILVPFIFLSLFEVVNSKFINLGNSLVVQWFGLHASTAGGTGPIPGRGTKTQHAVRWGQKKQRNANLLTHMICRNTGTKVHPAP